MLFLEEDHYVTEDFLHVLKLTNEERLARHEDCDIICLGTYLKSPDMKKTAKQVSRPLILLRILGICVGWVSLYILLGVRTNKYQLHAQCISQMIIYDVAISFDLKKVHPRFCST